MALYNLGEFDRAQKILLNATRDPGNAAARAYLAMTLHALGEKQQANKFLEQAMQLEPHAGFYWLVRADWQMKAREYAGLLESAREILKREPWNDRGWAYQGAALHGLGRGKEAIPSYRTSLRLKPGDDAVTSGLAAVLAGSGENADARRCWRAHRKNRHTMPKAGSASAWMKKRKNIAEAERAYRKALELDPKAEHAWHRLGDCPDDIGA